MQILSLSFLLNLGLKRLIAPVRIWSLLRFIIMLVRCSVAVLMSEKLSMLKSVKSVSVMFVNAPHSALLWLV